MARTIFSWKLFDWSINTWGRAMDFDLKTYLWNGWRMNRRSQYKQMMMMSGFLTMQNIKENSNVETFLYHYLLMFTQIQRKFQIKPHTRHHTQRLKGIWLVFRQQWMSESVLNWDWHEHNLKGKVWKVLPPAGTISQRFCFEEKSVSLISSRLLPGISFHHFEGHLAACR